MLEGSSEQILCWLCHNIINDTDFEVIDEIITGILQDVLPRLNMEIKDKHIMCKTCHANLIAAFNFKSMCIDTEDVIFSYINSKEMPVVELKDVYLKEKGNVQLTDTSDVQKICRLCLQLVTCEYGFVSLNEVDVDIINNYIPQININAIKQPVICGLCSDSLHTHNSFVKNCLERQEQYLQSYIKTEEIDIKAEVSDQDSDSSSHNLFEGTIKNNKKKCASKDAFETMFEAPLDAPSIGGDCKLKNPELKMYKCSECDYQSDYTTSVKNHLVKHKNPSEVQMYKCGKCDFQTKYKQSLTFHKLKHEDVSKMLKCDVCTYETKYKRYLKLHQIMHKDPSEVQMYKCEVCDYTTKYKSVLKRHQLTHKDPSELQIFKCDVCDYKYKRKTDLKLHQLMHEDPSKIQMYQCNVCSYETRYKKNLVLHELTHKNPSEIQMYRCDVCDHETKRKVHLKKHILTHGKPPKA